MRRLVTKKLGISRRKVRLHDGGHRIRETPCKTGAGAMGAGAAATWTAAGDVVRTGVDATRTGGAAATGVEAELLEEHREKVGTCDR